ncbi:hypothetical protein ACFL35_19735 [Candidatus Riflebacteria bacterium]
MMKNIFNISTLFLLSGLIALFLVPIDMLNAKTRAQLIKEAEAARAKAKKVYNEQVKKSNSAARIAQKARKQFAQAKKRGRPC